MSADFASGSTRAAFLLRTVARDEHVDNRARLHCLYAAELLDPYSGMPATTETRIDAQTVIRDALRLLAAVPPSSSPTSCALPASTLAGRCTNPTHDP